MKDSYPQKIIFCLSSSSQTQSLGLLGAILKQNDWHLGIFREMYNDINLFEKNNRVSLLRFLITTNF